MPEHEPPVEHWSYDTLRTRLLTACREGRTGIAHIERLPQSLDFGIMGERLLQLRQQANDFTTHEYSLDVLYDPHTDSLRQTKQAIRGDKYRAVFKPRLLGRESVLKNLQGHERLTVKAAIDRFSTDEEQLDLLISDQPHSRLLRKHFAVPAAFHHTHPSEDSFSPKDVGTFLSVPLLRVFGLAMADGNLALLVRSNSTTTLPMEEYVATTTRWDKQISDRIYKLRDNSDVSSDNAQTRMVHAMVRTLAKRCAFGYYRSIAPENTKLQRVPNIER